MAEEKQLDFGGMSDGALIAMPLETLKLLSPRQRARYVAELALRGLNQNVLESSKSTPAKELRNRSLRITLTSGREIALVRLQQELTYYGMLAGRPDATMGERILR